MYVVVLFLLMSVCNAQQCLLDATCSSTEDVGYYYVDQTLENYLYIGAFIDIHQQGK